MQFSTQHLLQYESLVFGDEFQELFKLQKVSPYLPNKKEIGIFEGVEEIEKDKVSSRYAKKVMPWDIENEHIIKNREKLRSMPIGIKWTEEEMEQFNSLSDVKEKRDMILKKSELKSVYVPHLKWDKEMIKYPNMPHDAESKENFEKGYKLFNEEKYDEAFPLLRQAYNKGNYVAAQLLANILFERLNSKEFRDYYYKPKEMYDGVEAWIAADPEKNKKMIKEHDNIIKNIRIIANDLIRQELPIGYFLYAETYFHYLKKLGNHHFDKRYRKEYVKYLMEAANRGSYDAYMRLAVNDGDLEWLLCAMIVSHDYKCFDIFARSMDRYSNEYASPRNLAIVRLAAMWGSNYAMDCLTFGETGNFISTYNHRILNGYPDGAIYMPDEEMAYRSSIYNKYYGEDKGVFEGTLIPDLDTVYPPKPVIYSPFDMTTFIHYFLEDNYLTLIHPLSPKSTEDSIIKFREHLHKIEIEMWLDEATFEATKKYRDRKSTKDARRDMAMVEYEDIDRLFGYLNVIKLRELEQNPLYYPSGRIYIYPESFYKKHPDWY